MTEPEVASSDATNVQATATLDGEEVVVSGRKWWSTGIGHPRCEVIIFMGLTDPDADRYHQHSMVLVPLDTPGVKVERMLSTMGFLDAPGGHGEVSFTDVRLPASAIIGGLGQAFAIAQARLGPGRVHHCMRLIGIADARIAIDQARLRVLHAAWLIDKQSPDALGAVSQIKVAVPNMAQAVVDMPMQLHGGAGLSDDLPLGAAWTTARALRLADGPDEVHRGVIARLELARHGHGKWSS